MTTTEPATDTLNTDAQEPTICIGTNLIEADNVTFRGASQHLPADATDDDIAAELVASLRAVAALRGPGLVAAVDSLLVDTACELS